MRTCIFASIAVAVAATALPAAAQMTCGKRDDVVAQLGALHQERLTAAGLTDATHLVELWTTEDGATWTLLSTRADGIACVLGSGEAWLAYPESMIRASEG